MNRVIIISCYFGKLPVMFNVWADSCGENSDFDFLFITDQDVESRFPNLNIVRMSFEEIQLRIKYKVLKDACISKPYKLCDFKPVYGLIFSDYLKGYTFWGHCDIDMVFGKISDFITDEVLDRYDKIQYLGHLSLYRNIDKINKFCFKCGRDGVFTSETNYGFDEDQGIYQKFLENKIAVFAKRNFFDIYPFKSHMELDNIINRRMRRPLDINYKYQLFVWYQGRVYRFFIDRVHGSSWEEALYIHLGKNQIQECQYCPQYNTLVFSKHSIRTEYFNSLSEIGIMEMIEKYNHYSYWISLRDFWLHLYLKMKEKARRLLKK